MVGRRSVIEIFYDYNSFLYNPVKMACTENGLTTAYEKMQTQAQEQRIEQGGMEMRDVSSYAFTLNSLGWINCDRFYDTPLADKMQLEVKEEELAAVYIVFKSIKSIISLSRVQNIYHSPLVPKTMPIVLVSLKVKDGKAYLAKHETTVAAASNVQLKYNAYTLPQIRTEMAALN
jgi:hypothetical protein